MSGRRRFNISRGRSICIRFHEYPCAFAYPYHHNLQAVQAAAAVVVTPPAYGGGNAIFTFVHSHVKFVNAESE